MHRLLKISQQTSWQLIGKVISSFSTIIILGLITRTYGEEGTGIFTLAMTYLAYFSLSADFGLNAYLLPRFIDSEPLIWRKLLGMRLLLSLVLILLGFIGILIWPTDLVLKQVALIGLVISIIEPAVFTTANALFQSKLRYDLSVMSWTAGSIAELIAVFFIVKFSSSLPLLMLAYVFGWSIMLVLSLVFVFKFLKNITPIIDWQFIKATLKGCWPISLTLVLNVLYFRLDTFILSFYRSFAEVGIYNLAYQIFQAALVMPAFIMNVLYPLMLKDFSIDQNKFSKNLVKYTILMFGLGILGTILTLVLAPWVINVLTSGNGFDGSISSLQILSFSFPAFFASSVLMWALVVYKKYHAIVWIYLIGLLINLFLNLSFIPQYSFLAASAITGISEYLILSLQIITLSRVRFKL